MGGWWGADAGKVEVARSMRARPTEAEAAMWTLLRYRRLGWKFRRQHVIAGYVVDFYCAALRLAVEVDGSVHDTRVLEDRKRDANLTALGVWVLHVHNTDILERPAYVRNALTRYCDLLARQTTPLTLPRPRGRDPRPTR